MYVGLLFQNPYACWNEDYVRKWNHRFDKEMREGNWVANNLPIGST